MMASRKRRRLLIALGLVLAAVAAWYLLAPVPRISSYYSRKIQPGMTRAQVETILGGPPGDYRTAPFRLPDDQIIAQVPAGERWLPAGEQWQGDRFSVYVTFDAQGRVDKVTGFMPGPMPGSWYRALQEWMPLPD
jgi:hypothetical protein